VGNVLRPHDLLSEVNNRGLTACCTHSTGYLGSRFRARYKVVDIKLSQVDPLVSYNNSTCPKRPRYLSLDSLKGACERVKDNHRVIELSCLKVCEVISSFSSYLFCSTEHLCSVRHDSS